LAALGLCLLLTLMPTSAWASIPTPASTPAASVAPVASVASVSTRAPSPSLEVSADGTTARITGGTLGVFDCARYNKGTNKTYEGQSFGYRFPMTGPDAFAVLALSETDVLVYVPPALTERYLGYPGATDDFIALLCALDEALAHGGTTLASLGSARFEFVSTTSLERGGYRYEFAREVEPGHYSACVMQPDAANPTTPDAPAAPPDATTPATPPIHPATTPAPEPLFALSGQLSDASALSILKPPEGLAAITAFFSSLDSRPFWVSLRTSAVAMLFVFVLGLAAAWFSQRISSRLKAVLDSLFTIPMVLPPTVCGFLLLVVFGKSTAFGRWLIDHGIELVFSWPAAVLAAVIVAFPLMYRTARGAFEALDPALSDAARTLGWSEARIFFRLILPLSWPSIAAGTVLAFARAIGEFGATLFVAGNYPGVTQTMPIAIYFQWMGGHPEIAAFWVAVVILISFVVILFINWYAARTQRYRRASASELQEPTDKQDSCGEDRALIPS
jgi:molybdate transport system permease protein